MHRTKEEAIAAAVSTRRGRITLAHAMVYPISGGNTPIPCETCGLRYAADCEAIHPTDEQGRCKIPKGIVGIEDERRERAGRTVAKRRVDLASQRRVGRRVGSFSQMLPRVKL